MHAKRFLFVTIIFLSCPLLRLPSHPRRRQLPRVRVGGAPLPMPAHPPPIDFLRFFRGLHATAARHPAALHAPPPVLCLGSSSSSSTTASLALTSSLALLCRRSRLVCLACPRRVMGFRRNGLLALALGLGNTKAHKLASPPAFVDPCLDAWVAARLRVSSHAACPPALHLQRSPLTSHWLLARWHGWGA